jgi:hypothetical protein
MSPLQRTALREALKKLETTSGNLIGLWAEKGRLKPEDHALAKEAYELVGGAKDWIQAVLDEKGQP